MRYKYSKALRRRELWEREAVHPRRGWHVPHHWIKRRLFDAESMSSSSRLQADVQEPEKDETSITRPMENQYSEEFARFKAAVDKDPFVAVFGRRLQSPPSSNNSSWTSLLRIFETVPTEDTPPSKSSLGPKPTTTTPSKKDDFPKRSSTNATSETPVPRSIQPNSTANPDVMDDEAEYEFDPISMKKVPKKKLETQPSAEGDKKPFLSNLFAEHGVDIPVKTYKPHKVYGYTGNDAPRARSGRTDESASSQTVKRKFESSRLQDLQKLKVNKLGNAVDATNFCGKYQVKENDTRNALSDKIKPSFDSAASTDDAPLFSGTTYESKSHAILATKTVPRKDWLAQEGFRTSKVTSEPSLKSATVSTSPGQRVPAELMSRIEPSLDRIQSAGAQDRSMEGRPRKPVIEPESDKTEDLDLLRPSDVRAQVGSSRKTRHQADLNKKEALQRPETDYASRQRQSDETSGKADEMITSSTRKLQDGLSSLWKRVQNQPQYTNLANTIKNMGAFQDAWKKYSREKVVKDPNEKLVFKDANLSQAPSIYKKTTNKARKAFDTFTSSKEVVNAEREDQNRTAVLRAANEKAKREEAERKIRDTELASEIRQAYESQYGPIDVNHRQVLPTVENTTPKPADAQIKAVIETENNHVQNSQMPSSEVAQGSPTSTAEIEKVSKATSPQRDVMTLQPQIDRLVDKVKNTRKVLHEVSLHVKAMKSRRPPTYWNTPIAEASLDPAESAIAQTPRKTLEHQKAPVLEIKSSQEGAARDIAAYTASVVSANQAVDRAQALREMREPRVNQVQQKEAWVQPLVPRMQDLAYPATPNAVESTASRVNQVQASEKAAVEASAETLAQQRTRDIRDGPAVAEVSAAGARPAKAVSDSESSPPDTASSVQHGPGLYKILAYDSSTLQVSMATTTSSVYLSTSGNGDVESPLHPTEVLSRLNNPAKFLPYFQGLQDDGYEIVSGSGDILVFKKVREDLTSTATDGVPKMAVPPTTQPDEPVRKEAATVLEDFPSKPAPAPPAPPSSPKVRRQENVFSGSGKTWHQEEAQSQSNSDGEGADEGAWCRIKRGARRVLFTGLATAGTVYAIGAVAESFGAQQQPLYEEGQVKRRGTRPGIYSTESSR